MKKLFTYFLKTLPRPLLIRLSYPFKAVAPYVLRGSRFFDPIDQKAYSTFFPYGAKIQRPNAMAPGTLSLERHRLMWLFLKEKTNFFTDHLKVLHIAPEQCFYKRFRKMDNLDYTTGDLFSPLADVKMDLHDIPFEENTFDVIFCNHVLEHVDDYNQCMREMLRVLKPGGWGIFQVPIDYNRAETWEDPKINTPELREEHYWQKDHLRLFGLDYGTFLKNAGFDVDENRFVDEIPAEEVERMRLPAEETIYYCHKPKA